MSVKLGDICKFQSGGTPSRAKTEYFSGNIPWITTISLNGGSISKDAAVEWITDNAINESAAKIVPAFSIMVGTRVGVGKVAINTVPMSTSQDIISLLEIDEKIWNKDFLCKFIQTRTGYLNAQARGATIKGIKIEVLANLEVPEKSVEEQTVISNKIDRIKGLILKRKQELGLLDELISARFVEMFSGESNMMKMSDICSIITDGTHQPPKFVAEGIPFIFVSNVVNDKLTYDAEKFITQETCDELIKRTPIEIGDVLLSTVGSYGHPAVVKSDKKFLFQRHIAYLKPKKEIIDSDYLHGALLSPDAQRQIEEGVKGIAQKTLNLSEIKQKQFADFVEQVNKSKVAVQKSLGETQTLFDSLMQEYFG